MRQERRWSKVNIVPEYIQLYPTLRCNQRCSFCFNDTQKTVPDMTARDAGELLDVMQSFRIGELDIMGGEPLLLPWMPDFVRDAVRRGISVNISTNGSLSRQLKKLDGISPGLLTVGISLEGSSRERHEGITCSRNFTAAVANLSWLAETGFNPLVKTVVNTQTAGDIPDLVNLIRRRGIRRYYLIHMDLLHPGPGRGAALSYPEFMLFADGIRLANPGMDIHTVSSSCFNGSARSLGLRCAAGARKIAVMPDGSACPCNLFHGFPEFRLGNVFSEGLPAIMANPLLDYFRTYCGNRCPEQDCGNRPSCTGGCPAHAYSHFRRLDAPDLRCLSLPGIPRLHTCP